MRIAEERRKQQDDFCGLNFEFFKPFANLFWPANFSLFCLETVAENVRNMTKIIIKNVDTQPLTYRITLIRIRKRMPNEFYEIEGNWSNDKQIITIRNLLD